MGLTIKKIKQSKKGKREKSTEDRDGMRPRKKKKHKQSQSVEQDLIRPLTLFALRSQSSFKRDGKWVDICYSTQSKFPPSSKDASVTNSTCERLLAFDQKFASLQQRHRSA